MTRIVLPAQTVQMDENTGIDPVWYEKLQQINAFVNLFSEIDFATMTTGQVLIWDAATQKFTAGAN